MYDNTLQDFKKWCRANKMPFEIAITKYYKKGDLYLEANKVHNLSGSGYFLGLSARRYDPEKKTFVHTDNDNARKVFYEEIKRFCQTYGLEA